MSTQRPDVFERTPTCCVLLFPLRVDRHFVSPFASRVSLYSCQSLFDPPPDRRHCLKVSDVSYPSLLRLSPLLLRLTLLRAHRPLQAPQQPQRRRVPPIQQRMPARLRQARPLQRVLVLVLAVLLAALSHGPPLPRERQAVSAVRHRLPLQTQQLRRQRRPKAQEHGLVGQRARAHARDPKGVLAYSLHVARRRQRSGPRRRLQRPPPSQQQVRAVQAPVLLRHAHRHGPPPLHRLQGQAVQAPVLLPHVYRPRYLRAQPQLPHHRVPRLLRLVCEKARNRLAPPRAV